MIDVTNTRTDSRPIPSDGCRRVLPVVNWLKIGAAAAGIALATAPVAAADDGGSASPRGADSAAAASSEAPAASEQAPAASSEAPAAATRGPKSGANRSPASAGQGAGSDAPHADGGRVRRGATAVPAASVPPQAGAARRVSEAWAGTAASPAAVASALSSTSASSVGSVVESAPGIVAPSAPVAAASTAPVITSLTNVINGVLDTLANLLSSFPANPISDLASGALLLIRRTLSLIEPVPATAPVATSVWLPNAGTYGTDAEMNFVVNFDQPVVVNNANVAVPVEINYILYNAQYVSGSGTGSLLFSLDTPAEELDPSGIDLGTVSTVTATRVFDFGDRIVAKANQAVASSAIPTVNTSRITVDSMGPQITGRSDLQVSGSDVTLTVTFDRPVIVTGTPTVPVVLDSGLSTQRNVELQYARGNQTNTLTFRLSNPSGTTVTSAEFGKYVGDVIYLSPTAGISDRTGSQIYTLEGDLDTPLIENGNHVVVIGQHFERLQTQTVADLNAILNGVPWPGGPPEAWNYPDSKVYLKNGTGPFWYETTFGPPYYPNPSQFTLTPWPFNTPYQLPTPVPATYDVALYRVAYRTSVPEEDRYTTAYGVVAIPVTKYDTKGNATPVTGAVNVVEWQQPTVFNIKYSAPSQAFACGAVPTCASNSSENANPRLEIAQFGGQGYAVFIPDPFGMGNSPNHYAYQLVDSAAQYSIDMLTAGQALLAARNLEQNNLFIAGWSAGGNQNAAFLQRLNDEGVEVAGAVIASSPLDVAATIQKGIFNPRQWDYTLPTHTGEAIWQNIALGYTAFAQGSFQNQQSVPLELFGNYYDALRRIYTQQYTALILGELTGAPGPLGLSGVTVEFTDVDGATQSEFVPYQLRSTPVVGQTQNGAIVLKYSIDEAAYNTSQYAILMRGDDPDVGNDTETGDQLWLSPARLFYGKEDEVLPATAGQDAYDKQVAFGNQDIEITKIDNSNHRGTYLQAMANALAWFNSIAGIIIE